MKKLPLGMFTTFFMFLYLAIFFGSSASLSCKKLEKNHTKCQLQNFQIFGLVSTSVENFRLTKTDVQMPKEDGEGGSQTFSKLLLYDQDRSFKFYEHQQFFFLQNDTQLNKKQIDTFIAEANEKSTLRITSRSYFRLVKYLIEIIFTYIILVVVLTMFSVGNSAFKKR